MRASLTPLALAVGLSGGIGLSGCVSPPDIAPLQHEITERVPRISPVLADTSFGQAVRMAVEDSPALGRGQAALDEARALLEAEQSGYFPDLTIGLSTPIHGGIDVLFYGTISSILYDGGERASRERAAEAQVLGQFARRLETGSQAALTAVEVWVSVATARRLERASWESLVAMEEIATRIRVHHGTSSRSSADSLTSIGRLENLRAELVSARTKVAQAEAVFMETFPRLSPALVTGLPPAIPTPPPFEVEGSPIVQQAQARLLASAARLASARAGLVPPLRASVSETSASRGAESLLQSETVIEPTRPRNAEVHLAKARVIANEAELTLTRREMERRLAILESETRLIKPRLQATQRASWVNRRNVSDARQQFGIGQRTLIELIDTEREALIAEQLKIGAEVDNILLEYAALAVTGDLLDLFGITLPPLGASR